MREIKFSVDKRDAQGKGLVALRTQGLVPGIVYGQGKEAIMVAASERVLDKVYHTAGTSKLVQLEIEGGEAKTVLFHEVQYHPVIRRIVHFDLFNVRMDQKIRTEVPIHLEGEAPAIHNLGAVLLQTLDSIEVEALPKDLPENLTLNIDSLDDIGKSLHVRDIKVPEGVELYDIDPEEMIVKIEAPQETTAEEIAEEDAATAEAVDLEEVVEADRGGKEEAEGEEGAETSEAEAPPKPEPEKE
jgi:large subunit ribosomal protein L25